MGTVSAVPTSHLCLQSNIVCWFARIDVVLVDDKRLHHDVVVPDDLRGELPTLWAGAMCACDLVEDRDGTVVTPLVPSIRALVEQDRIKRVEVMWWWGDDPPATSGDERLGIAEFVLRADGQVAPGVRYRVNDPGRWSHTS